MQNIIAGRIRVGRLATTGLFLQAAAVAATLLFLARPSCAATLTVGADQSYKAPSDAASAAKPGDVIRIAPGTYFDCAVWTANNISIEGAAQGTIVTDKICQGKALFVIHADNVTVRNITFQRARSNDGNGAGIRAEGNNLTIENSQFINNQDGILEGDNPQATLIVRNSRFDHNGSCLNACAHGIYVGHIALLQIENSRFFNTQVAHHIKSRAARTVLTGNHIEDGPEGTASYEVELPNGGSLVMTGNTLEKGPNNQNHSAAVVIGDEGVTQMTDELVLRNNVFTDDGPPTAFVKNITATPAQLVGNIFKGRITPLIGDGTVH